MRRWAQFKSEVEVSSHVPASKVTSTFPFNLNSLLSPAWLGLLALTVLAATGWGQTTIFSDNFGTSRGSNYSTSAGAIGTDSNWLLTRSGADWGARINGGILDLSNDASGTANANGWIFGYRDINALAGWNTTLSSNTGTITWEFNMRQTRTDPADHRLPIERKAEA